MCRVGHNRIYAPYTTKYLVFLLPNIPCVHRIYMVLATVYIWLWPTLQVCCGPSQPVCVDCCVWPCWLLKIIGLLVISLHKAAVANTRV